MSLPTKEKKVGRPRQFDEREVLQKITLLFWEKGFHGTSVNDLCATTGLTKPSLYATFGDKESVFLSALDFYLMQAPQREKQFLESSEPLRDVVMQIIEQAVVGIPNQRPPGCLLVNASTEIGHLEAYQSVVEQGHDNNEHALQYLFEQAQHEGRLATDKDPKSLAQFVNLVIQGLAVMHSNGKDLDDLRKGIDTALAALE